MKSRLKTVYYSPVSGSAPVSRSEAHLCLAQGHLWDDPQSMDTTCPRCGTRRVRTLTKKKN